MLLTGGTINALVKNWIRHDEPGLFKCISFAGIRIEVMR